MEFTRSLDNLSDSDIRNILRSRHRDVFGEIQPVLKNEEKSKLSTIQEAFHRVCEPKFKSFVTCQYNLMSGNKL